MKTLFLGSGYLGDYYRRLYPYSIHTSRSKEKLRHLGRGMVFNSELPETWRNIAMLKPEGIIISFPLDSCSNPIELDSFLRTLTDKIVIIGSTSAFRSDLKLITDESPIDSSNKRAAVEERFRLRGAVVLHSAGIYGEGRNPLDWIRKGMIKDTAGSVNLIHAEDLARACNFLLEDFRPSERYVLSDSQSYRWQDIMNYALERKLLLESQLPVFGKSSSPAPVKRVIRPCRLREEGFRLKHPELFEELRKLEELA
ncbi:MAG: hypothetical protein HF314_14630 [Ignavibacteria bacterium]|jgi:hypothetical protein|nr:hypothetical protein [Ignavibacteria bacterium]MCU7504315.1 hypothetical protein [Ignavibacteria bacterium]MCU7516160.1 hypothetical protein [Ignavibacteria bacterium]